ncbi:Lysoplasmalogenase [Paenibacillus sp. P22]|nr:Lysoplasmalogenase [Paenibacillus sp. P22]
MSSIRNQGRNGELPERAANTDPSASTNGVMFSMSSALLPVLIVMMGLIYIFVIPSDPEGVKIVFKLIPMALILLYAYLGSFGGRRRYPALVLSGLLFCAVGDGTLRWFVVGLSAFLIGHLFYMSAFFGRWRFSRLRFATIVPIAVFAFLMGSKLISTLAADGKTELIVPVAAYVAVISLMAWSAIMSGNRLAIAGSLLFMLSDSILSWNMFVSDVAYSGYWIMLTYYAAQFLIAGSLRPGSGKSSYPSVSYRDSAL